MIAEAAPRCTICGVQLVRSGSVLVHYEPGRPTFAGSRTPVHHQATLDPAALVVWLRLW